MLITAAVVATAQNSSYNANTIPIGGVYSTAFGSSALHVNTGNGNTASGFGAMYSNTSGASNTATGRSSMYLNTTGSGNTANGYFSLFGNSTGAGNTASGYFTMFNNSTGANNTAAGYLALYNNTTGSLNVANGYQALYSNNSGSRNVGYGYQALYANTSGGENMAFGYQTLYSNTTGSGNLAVGEWAMQYNTTGWNNTALGFDALAYNGSGFLNLAVGHGALTLNTAGYYNSAGGYYALYNNTTGAGNTAFGRNTLLTNTAGNFNAAFGADADVSSGNLSNATAIGCGAIVDATNKVRIGSSAVTSIGGQVGWTIYSDSRVKKNIKEDVPGLAFVSLLKPVTYNYDIAKENELMGKKNDTLQWAGKNDIEKIKFTGFLAQAVDEAAKKINYEFSGIDKTGNIMGLRYSDFIVPMVKAIQEQQQQIDELKQLLASGTTITSSSMELSDRNGFALNQNAPNPFTKQTSIGFRIPQNAGSAQLVFYDATGRLISSHSITDRGRGLITITANDLSTGVYSYSLVVDGKLMDSKKLVKQ